MSRIAILGGGSWGTALSILFSRTREIHAISLWARDAELAHEMQEKRENAAYLRGQSIPEAVTVTADLRVALSGAEIVVGAMPSAHAREIYQTALPFFRAQAIFVSATKGLEPATHLRMSKVIAQVMQPRFQAKVAVLSGPSFALEAARGEPTAVVLACEDEGVARLLQEKLGGPAFRLYANSDVLGVELAGAMKNVIAIAAGACQGLGFGANTLAALITRGLAEMARLATALGAKPETLSGLAGLGDLVLTCTGTLSRNRYVGQELGKGRLLKDILAGMKSVAEGVWTADALLSLARENGVEMPIAEQVNAILHEGKSPTAAIRAIMDRPQKRE
ncbi:MAG: NAD(P)-dependent glycerol-3-phosphate dehydrogenase [Acidobacteria bacterium]|nr:NAD(P)-dependent glycerol-3-phosphate dehydrogenase [Acidobacteriota bacterium]MBS1867072.1 NAD(P)-dependent glycerol-3-phosphate dehydrogenase [Acidobacteriota bacterium]